jgi:hypothetical protein
MRHAAIGRPEGSAAPHPKCRGTQTVGTQTFGTQTVGTQTFGTQTFGTSASNSKRDENSPR